MSIVVEDVAQGHRIFWGAPTYQQVRIGFDETRAACRGWGNFNPSRMEATFPSGGSIIYRSLDNPDNARGYTADGIVIDETADVRPQAWYEVLRPMLIDTGGWLWAIGTPKGRNWFYLEHMAAQDRDDTMAWQVPTLGCTIVNGELIRKPHPLENPYIPWEEIVNLWKTMPEQTFRQELIAEFVENQSAIFRKVAAACRLPVGDWLTHHGHTKVMGVDWGKKQDYTAISVGCATCRCELAIDRFNTIDYAFQTDRLWSLYNAWGPSWVVAEANSMGEPLIDFLQRSGMPVVPFYTTSQSKNPMIERLALAIERGEWAFLADAVWQAELEAYELKRNPITGHVTYSAPDGVHDDTCIARGLMLYCADHVFEFTMVGSAVVMEEQVEISPF